MNWTAAREIHESIKLKDLTNKEVVKLLKKKKDKRPGRLRDIYGGNDNGAVTRLIFKTFLWKVLNKVVEGNIFVLPLSTKPNIYAASLSDESIQKARQEGKYSFINLRKTNYKIYTLKYGFGSKVRKFDYDIIVPKELYAKFVRNQNNGQAYSRIPKIHNVIRNRGFNRRNV